MFSAWGASKTKSVGDVVDKAALWKSRVRYRIGKQFLGLDTAGNVVCYYSYKKPAGSLFFGAWGPITVSDITKIDVTKPGGYSILVENHPMHSKCASIIEDITQKLYEHKKYLESKKVVELKNRHANILSEMGKEEEMEARDKSRVAGVNDGGNVDKKDGSLHENNNKEETSQGNTTTQSPSSSESSSPKEENPDKQHLQRAVLSPSILKMDHTKTLRLKAHTGSSDIDTFDMPYELKRCLYSHTLLRLNRLVTWSYKTIYYSLILSGGLMLLILYHRFKYWLNPAARQGLDNIERQALVYPRKLMRKWCRDVWYPFMDSVDDFIYPDDALTNTTSDKEQSRSKNSISINNNNNNNVSSTSEGNPSDNTVSLSYSPLLLFLSDELLMMRSSAVELARTALRGIVESLGKSFNAVAYVALQERLHQRAQEAELMEQRRVEEERRAQRRKKEVIGFLLVSLFLLLV
eukprot:Tbor_TRINITY_DN5441_c4_g2::TRINITY_DN5441_c4_g2_i1::g.25455::m.25455